MKLYLKAIVITLAAGVIGYLSHVGNWMGLEIGELRTFFAISGVVYGIVSGFVLMQVLRNYGDLKAHISSELNALQDYRDYLGLLDVDPQIVDDIRTRLMEYVDSVISKEWPTMGDCNSTDPDTSDEMYRLLVATHRIEPTNTSDELAFKKMVDLFGEITTHRTRRLVAAGDELPPLLRHLILFLTLIVIGVFTVIPFGSAILGVILKVTVAFALSFIYLLIVDLNDPFAGAWRIRADLFRKLRERIKDHGSRPNGEMPADDDAQPEQQDSPAPAAEPV